MLDRLIGGFLIATLLFVAGREWQIPWMENLSMGMGIVTAVLFAVEGYLSWVQAEHRRFRDESDTPSWTRYALLYLPGMLEALVFSMAILGGVTVFVFDEAVPKRAIEISQWLCLGILAPSLLLGALGWVAIKVRLIEPRAPLPHQQQGRWWWLK